MKNNAKELTNGTVVINKQTNENSYELTHGTVVTENKSNKKIIIYAIIGGIIVGFLNGFFGGGGGMIVVPFLVFLLGLEDKKAHATAIFIILPISIVSSIIYLINGQVKWPELSFTTMGFVAGGILGAFLLQKINNSVVRIIFSFVMIFAGIAMLIF